MENAYGGVFRVQGAPSNLQLRVTLIYNGTSFGNMPSLTEAASGSLAAPVSASVDEITLRWLQKIEKRSETDGTVSEGSRRERRLFTYIQGDELPSHLEALNPTAKATTASEAPETNDPMRNTRSKRISPFDIWKRGSPLVDLPVKEDRRKMLICRKEVMYVMAHLGPLGRSESEEDVDFVVCRITMLGSHTLIFEPALRPAGIKLESRYGIYTAHISVLEEQFTDIGLPSIQRTEEDFVTDESFVLPLGRSIHYNYFIEIDEAVNFPNDGLFIEYKIDIPPKFRIIDREQLCGRTAICYTKEVDKDDIAYFSHPIQVSFAWDEDYGANLEKNSGSWPIMLFRVCALDYWGRFYVSGYGSLHLPTAEPREHVRVCCWRPYSNVALHQLQEYFVGQSVDIVDFFNMPNQGIAISRAGLETEDSGHLTLNISRLIQYRQFVTNEMMNKMKYGSMLYKIGLNTNLHWRIMKVLMEFEEARRELLRIRGIQTKEKLVHK